MYFILLAVAQKPAHGYEIMKLVTEISAERVKVGAGTLYALLTRFENEKIVQCVGNDGRRKTYAITDRGHKILQAEYRRLSECAAAYERVINNNEGAGE
jgi:DNA-binding PadR family transcriptional regulator